MSGLVLDLGQQDGLALAEIVVGQPAADQRRDVDQPGEPGVQPERLGVGPAEAEAALDYGLIDKIIVSRE